MMSKECCGGGADACRKDQTGTMRCLGPAAGGSSCTLAGYPCVLAEQCCGSHCLPDGTGALSCRSSCAPLGAACTANEDCCDGTCLGPPGRTACVGVNAPIDAARCTPAGDACDPLAAFCCGGSLCAIVSGGGHACAPAPQ
jgi:hypothetical protein